MILYLRIKTRVIMTTAAGRSLLIRKRVARENVAMHARACTRIDSTYRVQSFLSRATLYARLLSTIATDSLLLNSGQSRARVAYLQERSMKISSAFRPIDTFDRDDRLCQRNTRVLCVNTRRTFGLRSVLQEYFESMQNTNHLVVS